MDPWERQRALARTTAVWAVASLTGGVAIAARPDPWWRAFGQQHLGWGAVDLGIVALVTALQNRRMRRLANPYTIALERERRWLRTILLVNMVADVGYIAIGAALWRGRGRSARASGAGAAIVIQGAFLLVQDTRHRRL